MSEDIPVRRTSSGTRHLQFAASSAAMAVAPVYMFWSFFDVDPLEASITPFLLVGAVATLVLVYLSYSNVANGVYRRLMVKRQSAVTNEIIKAATNEKELPEGKEQRSKYREQLSDKLNDTVHTVSNSEATSLSIVYNNVLFVILFLFFCFYLFRAANDIV